jgi:hypothetical protein
MARRGGLARPQTPLALAHAEGHARYARAALAWLRDALPRDVTGHEPVRGFASSRRRLPGHDALPAGADHVHPIAPAPCAAPQPGGSAECRHGRPGWGQGGLRRPDGGRTSRSAGRGRSAPPALSWRSAVIAHGASVVAGSTWSRICFSPGNGPKAPGDLARKWLLNAAFRTRIRNDGHGSAHGNPPTD